MDVLHDRATIIAHEDIISNLPNEIIHHILSFLDMKYAIQTSILSKKWKHIWTSTPHLNLKSRTSRTWPQFAKFVNDALSHRNHGIELSTVELSFGGAATHFDSVVTSIVSYAYSHNVTKLTITWLFRLDHEVLEFPKGLFRSHTLKHLTLAIHCFNGRGLSVPKSAWDFPVLETLNLRNLRLSDSGDKSLNLFSKCVNLKDLTLHKCSMYGLDIFNVCAPKLSNLTIIDSFQFPKVFNVVAPQLETLTASVRDWDAFNHFLPLSVEDLDSLEKVNLSMEPTFGEKERFAPGLLDLFQKLCGAKFLILDNGIIEVISACLDQLSDVPCPFNNLKWLKQKEITPAMPTKVRNYLLESSPSANFIMDLPQVPPKRSSQEVDNGTTASTLEEEKQETKTVDEEKRTPEAKSLKQDEVIGEKMAMLEEMKLQHEKIIMLEAKIAVQDKVIARQKTMVEAAKMLHENRMLEEKMQMQDELITEQKVMLETMKLQNEKRMFEANIQRQDKIISQQKAMLEAMKLEHEKIEAEPGNIDG